MACFSQEINIGTLLLTKLQILSRFVVFPQCHFSAPGSQPDITLHLFSFLLRLFRSFIVSLTSFLMILAVLRSTGPLFSSKCVHVDLSEDFLMITHRLRVSGGKSGQVKSCTDHLLPGARCPQDVAVEVSFHYLVGEWSSDFATAKVLLVWVLECLLFLF